MLVPFLPKPPARSYLVTSVTVSAATAKELGLVESYEKVWHSKQPKLVWLVEEDRLAEAMAKYETLGLKRLSQIRGAPDLNWWEEMAAVELVSRGTYTDDFRRGVFCPQKTYNLYSRAELFTALPSVIKRGAELRLELEPIEEAAAEAKWQAALAAEEARDKARAASWAAEALREEAKAPLRMAMRATASGIKRTTGNGRPASDAQLRYLATLWWDAGLTAEQFTDLRGDVHLTVKRASLLIDRSRLILPTAVDVSPVLNGTLEEQTIHDIGNFLNDNLLRWWFAVEEGVLIHGVRVADVDSVIVLTKGDMTLELPKSYSNDRKTVFFEVSDPDSLTDWSLIFRAIAVSRDTREAA
jgi:hypothetical protein